MVNAEVVGMPALAESVPVLRCLGPGELRVLIEDAFLLNCFRVFEGPFRAGFVEVDRCLPTDPDSSVDEVVTTIEPQPSDQPVVGFVVGPERLVAVDCDALVRQRFVNDLIICEQFSKLPLLV